MNSRPTKPRLVFFQYRYDEKLPEFLLIHKRDHVECLSEFFDVTVIDHDCDYQEICDTHQPDLALFESGVNHTTCKRLKITNIRACPGVPRVGLHNADAFCNARTGFLSDMDHWEIDTFFAITTTAPEHTPEIADNFFIWPNCINPKTYRDYGAWKSIPVLFCGNTNALYPWRQKILKLVSERYPSLICPHPGYDPGPAAAQILFGEPYARMINASAMVPACGTVAKDVVRKHFEVPACRSCLVTEQSAALEAAGFVDMENCVFVDETDVLDKLAYLFQNPETLQHITDRGYHLAHSRHTLRQRDQIFQWYTLSRNLPPHQRIVQTNPFGPLAVVDRSSGISSGHVMGGGVHLRLLRDGDELLWAGKYLEAEHAYVKCMNYMRWMPEPKLRVALCKLYSGDARAALRWISEQIEFILGGYGAMDPDPVEWAYYILALLCRGELEHAVRAASQFSWLRHPELDRMRTVVSLVTGSRLASVPVPEAKQRRTIHQLPARNWSEWRDQVCVMLRACGQPGLAEQLTRFGERAASQEQVVGSSRSFAVEPADQSASRPFRRRFLKRTTGWAFKRRVADGLHRLETRFGYFLPYHLSAMKRDEFFGHLRRLAKELEIKRVILLGVAQGVGRTEALLAGIADADAKAEVFCVGRSGNELRRFEKAFAGRVRCYGVRARSRAELARKIDVVVGEIKKAHQIDAWDAVLIDASIAEHPHVIGSELEQDLRRARLVAFDGINRIGVYEKHDRLLQDPDYVLVAHDPELRNGYAIFKRKPRRVDAADECGWSLANAF